MRRPHITCSGAGGQPRSSLPTSHLVWRRLLLLLLLTGCPEQLASLGCDSDDDCAAGTTCSADGICAEGEAKAKKEKEKEKKEKAKKEKAKEKKEKAKEKEKEKPVATAS